MAWAQKLCHFANASSCHEDDPEFQRVANAFRASNHDWKTLVRELYSSPLVTYADKTKTAETDGAVISIARRETLCTRLGNRLGINDACNIKGQSGWPGQAATSARNLSFGIAGSSYARADEKPVMPHDPNLFFSSATEKLCMVLAAQLVDGDMSPRWRAAGLQPGPRRLRARGDGRAGQRRAVRPPCATCWPSTTTPPSRPRSGRPTRSAPPSCWRARPRWRSLRVCRRRTPMEKHRDPEAAAAGGTHSRRTLLKTTLFGASGLGLRALATGLPVSFLARPLEARAEVYHAPTRPGRST